MKQTFGGEIETLVVDKNMILADTDISNIKRRGTIEGGDLNYDSCSHLLELNIHVTDSLEKVLENVDKALRGLITEVHTFSLCLVNTSSFPDGTYEEAYKNNIRKVVYSLVRGPITQNEKELFSCLGNEYQHRNWKHEISSMFAGIQPWNSIDIDSAEEHFQALFITSFLAKFISANGPFFHGKQTDFTENRWRMYDRKEGMLSSSIYEKDQNLLGTFEKLDFSLGSYFQELFTNSIVSFIGSKKGLLALKKPTELYLLLEEQNIEFVNSGTNEKICLEDIYSNFSFSDIYESLVHFPEFKLRIVGGKPIIGEDFKKIIQAIQSGDTSTIISIFQKYGTEFAIEGRNYSTILPKENDDALTKFPFIFQTLVLKNSKAINSFLEECDISLNDIQVGTNNIYSKGIGFLDKHIILRLIEIIFSGTEDFTQQEQNEIHKIKNMILAFINNNNNKSIKDKEKYGKDVDAYLKGNLV